MADFLAFRFEAGCGSATLASITSAIAFGHRLSGLPDPTTDFRIRSLLAGARRLRPGGDLRLPLTVPDIQRLCSALNNVPLDPIARAAFRAIFTLAFFAMLRPGEVSLGSDSTHTIRLDGVQVHQNRLTVIVPSSKTSSVPFQVELSARPDLTVCPVAAMRDFLVIRGQGPPHSPLFVDGRHQPISARFLNGVMKAAAPSAGLDPARLSGHCLRIGGASHGAALGLSDLQLAQAGRWSAINAMRRYIRRPVSLLRATPSV